LVAPYSPTAAARSAGQFATLLAGTVEGRAIRIRTEGSQLRINDATVVQADVNASNGVIHVIDAS